MEEGYVILNKSTSRVVTFGGYIDRPLQKQNVVLIIPGTSGLIGYYEVFMKSLYEVLQHNYVIWGLGHGGHDFPPGVTLPSIRDCPEIFTIDGQVNHKIEFIDKYIPDGVNLHFIGHSIGAKICVELVKRYKERNNAHAYLLFPVIQRFAESPYGKVVWPFIGPLRKPLTLAVAVINKVMPQAWLHSIVDWFLDDFWKKGDHLPIDVEKTKDGIRESSSVHINVRTTVSLLHPEALERILFLANDEFQNIRELCADDIRRHTDRLVLYFGTKDQWCPLEYAHSLKRQVPEARTIVCPHGFDHAFNLRSSQHMANLVCDWIQTQASK